MERHRLVAPDAVESGTGRSYCLAPAMIALERNGNHSRLKQRSIWGIPEAYRPIREQRNRCWKVSTALAHAFTLPWSRLRSLGSKDPLDREFDGESATHLALLTATLGGAGCPNRTLERRRPNTK